VFITALVTNATSVPDASVVGVALGRDTVFTVLHIQRN
jgi:hypothetical protein